MDLSETSLPTLLDRTANGVVAILKDCMTPEELCDFTSYINHQMCKAYAAGTHNFIQNMRSEIKKDQTNLNHG